MHDAKLGTCFTENICPWYRPEIFLSRGWRTCIKDSPFRVDEDFPRRRSRPRIGARITGRTESRWSASQNLWYIGARNRSREIYFAARQYVGCDQCAVKVIITICRERTVAVSRHTIYLRHTRTRKHAWASTFLAYLTRVSLLRLSYATRYTGRCYLSPVYRFSTRVVSNFYHDLIDRFSMSDALFFVLLFDSRDRTKGASGLFPPLFSYPFFPPLRAMAHTFMLICS